MIDNLLVCVGAQKAGTTWLYKQLHSHPDIFFSNMKEIHYFTAINNNSSLLATRQVNKIDALIRKDKRLFIRYLRDKASGFDSDDYIGSLLSPVNDNWYLNLFKDKHVKYAADFTPDYSLLGVNGYRHIKRLANNVKVIFIMRDPVDRAKSAMKMFCRNRNIMVSNITEKKQIRLASSNFIIAFSNYVNTVNNLDAAFSSEDVLYFFYEDIIHHKQDCLNKIYKFLDIQKINIPKNKLEKAYNVTDKYSFTAEVDEFLTEKLKDVYCGIERRFGNLPVEWKLHK